MTGPDPAAAPTTAPAVAPLIAPGVAALEPAAQPSLRTQVAQVLRGLLVSGQLAPGTLCSVPRLAADFGVSVTPVREALLDLAGEGLLEPVRNRGFRVTELDDAELDELAELRCLLEVPTMVAVARDRTPATGEALEGLRPVAAQVVAAAAAGDLTAYVLADTEFHLRFLGLHGNGHLVDVVRGLRGRSRLTGLRGLVEADILRDQALEHGLLLDAALRHDAPRVRRLTTGHLRHVRGAWAGRAE